MQGHGCFCCNVLTPTGYAYIAAGTGKHYTPVFRRLFFIDRQLQESSCNGNFCHFSVLPLLYFYCAKFNTTAPVSGLMRITASPAGSEKFPLDALTS